METAATKRVRWSTVTVYEFGVTLGGSAVPRRGGPSIGLARKANSVWSATVDDIEYETCSSDDSDDVLELGVSEETELQCGKSRRHASRRRRVRWLKPQERVQLLTKAGCSEKRIYRMMMESSEIAMSRRLCVAIQREIPV
ncbi:hypothetical protein Poli38472_011568 [Pythium oligandrum]|uniref:Uncharacterized protein n=1 Tax=Pythium oligandrum TaxID=41045 RepID=A0A8K1CLT4_PYTOL|nr:hypothetical protein Poli38472_011568 [Pythium oligandrum]|eukprot:TMW64688.1 hypothetical protein Poli38472_011568 [Pythium oligandrum]